MAADRDGYARVGEALLATGTTAFQPTFVTAPEDALLEALREMPHDGIGPRVLGAHVEGPFLSPRRPACTTSAGCRAPDSRCSGGCSTPAPVRQMTLAPELRGAFELIDELRRARVTVSAGHTDATAAEAHLAFDRGVTTVTHLFNAMRQSTPRDPSIAVAALARADVIVQVIADLHHVAPRHGDGRLAGGVASGSRSSPTRRRPPGWATASSCSAGGRWWRPGGVVRGPEGQLAGSRADHDRRGPQPARARDPAGGRAARGLGGPGAGDGRPDVGRLAPGAPADIVVLDDQLEIVRVLVEGGDRVAR